METAAENYGLFTVSKSWNSFCCEVTTGYKWQKIDGTEHSEGARMQGSHF